MKAVGNHLVLTFCEKGELFTIILTRVKNVLERVVSRLLFPFFLLKAYLAPPTSRWADVREMKITSSTTLGRARDEQIHKYWFSLNSVVSLSLDDFFFAGCRIRSRFIDPTRLGSSGGPGALSTQFGDSSHDSHRIRVHSDGDAFNGKLRISVSRDINLFISFFYIC